jgi:hypothetical protein
VIVRAATVLVAVAVAAGAAGLPERDAEGSGGPQGRVGQFVVECGWSHSSFDDPIVHPGHAGASHRHDFFGNTATAARSTYEQLLASPTTCQQRLDTAAYWAPSVLAADGTPLAPVAATAYYRVGPGIDAAGVEAYPPDLRMVGGGETGTGPGAAAAWTCRAGASRVALPPACAATAGLELSIVFADCWDGVATDSADHRAHVAYSDDGACPSSHPVPIPQLELVIDYGPVEVAGLSLSSGAISTAHADFWNTWNQDKLETEVDACLRRRQVCGVTAG